MTDIGKKRANIVFIVIAFSLAACVIIFSAGKITESIGTKGTSYAFVEICIFFVCSVIHTVIHEFGHLVCGLITKYKFVSFRIGSLTLVKSDGVYKIKKMSIPGMAGQCLMSPPPLVDGKSKCILYLFGGGFFNILFTLIGIAIGLNMDVQGMIANNLIYVFGSIGLYMAIINLVPMSFGGTMNDGYTIFLENANAKKANHYLLELNTILSEIDSIRDIPTDLEEALLGFDYADLNSPCIANLYLYVGQYHISRGEYDLAQNAYERISSSGTVELLRNAARCELAFLDIYNNGHDAAPDEIIDDSTKGFIKKMKSNPAVIRYLYTYHLLYKNDLSEAEKLREQLDKAVKSYPIKADAMMEINIAREVEKKCKDFELNRKG